MTITSSAFSRKDLPDLIRFLGNLTAKRWPVPSVLMNSDLAWQLPGSDPKQNIRLWFDNGVLVAWAWFQPPGAFEFDIDPDRRDERFSVLSEVLAWVRERRLQFAPGSLPYLDYSNMDEWAAGIQHPLPDNPSAGKLLTVSVLESDLALRQWFADQGFKPTAHFQPFLVHDLAVDDLSLPAGFEIRSVEPDDFDAMAAAHRDAWAPSTGFSLERYQKVRDVPGCFDAGLHLLAQHESGVVAAHGIFWKDPVSGIGSLEPFGTRPAFRGTGISKALISSGLTRLAEAGMTAARIYTAGFNQPAQGLYKSCGFRETDRARTLIRQVPDLFAIT